MSSGKIGGKIFRESSWFLKMDVIFFGVVFSKFDSNWSRILEYFEFII
jgi:hypothetical protein